MSWFARSVRDSSVRADLRPAVEVEFSWVDGPPTDRRLALLCADRVGFLARRWVSQSERSAPVWLGRIVVPAGENVIECLDGDGAMVWSETVDRRPGRHRIALSGTPPVRLD